MTRFLLLVNYDNGVVSDGMPMLDWDPADIKAHMAYYEALNAELTERGELVGGEALAWPEASKIVRSDGKSAPVVTDGPYAEAKEQLAGLPDHRRRVARARPRDRSPGLGSARTGRRPDPAADRSPPGHGLRWSRRRVLTGAR